MSSARVRATSADGPLTFNANYVLPLRWRVETDLSEMTDYLATLSGWIDVVVVDGSSEEAFQQHHRAWQELVTHVAPGPWPGNNGKVRNVVTGIRLATRPLVVIADDDVRYTSTSLEQVLAALAMADLVVPQNVFSRWPWHARWDTGRQLANRAFGGDYPGTLAGRRSFLLGGYDGDVLFENLELMRTVAERGGRVQRLGNVFVDRVPPSTAHFWSQRVRQAYDSFAQPGRLVLEACLLPVLLIGCRHPRILAVLAVTGVVLGEVGRRRDGGAARFPSTAALWTPLWMVERALTSWVAIWTRLRGGVRYGDGRVIRAASRRRTHPAAGAARGTDSRSDSATE